jgi:hypothetical protein
MVIRSISEGLSGGQQDQVTFRRARRELLALGITTRFLSSTVFVSACIRVAKYKAKKGHGMESSSPKGSAG